MLRDYQQSAIDDIFDYWSDGGGNPLVEMATGTGKSYVIAGLIEQTLLRWPDMRILMLTHVRELVAQNMTALLTHWPAAPAGMYSAGLNKRDAHHKITLASIQSVYRRLKMLGDRDIVIIDEVHLCPPAGTGMYRKMLAGLRKTRPDLRIVGLSATPYRMGTGRLDGNGSLFDCTVSRYGIKDGIASGVLSPLISRASQTEIDVTKIARRGGEFVAASLVHAADEITDQAVQEIIKYGSDRQSWLIFCTGVAHGKMVRDVLRGHGIQCETVNGATPAGERDSIVQRFKSGHVQCITNTNCLTTGFDVASIDLLVMLRPTLSIGLYVQMVGRGTRLAPGKTNCMVLDFAGNIRRHGPVDSVDPPAHKKSTAVKIDTVRAKRCPECEEMVALNARLCLICGHEWIADSAPRHDAHSEQHRSILSSEQQVVPTFLSVIKWRFTLHEKRNKPLSMQVTYHCSRAGSLEQYKEWILFEHGGYCQKKAKAWWLARGGAMPVPLHTIFAMDRARDELLMPDAIAVRPRGKYTDIINYKQIGEQNVAENNIAEVG